MTNNTNPYLLHIERAGPNAWQAFQQKAQGHVIAVFEKCFYVNLNGAFICVGTTAFSDGPLNAISSAPALTIWSASGVKIGDPASLSNGFLRVGDHLQFRTGSSQEWSPPTLSNRRFTQSRLQAVHHFYLSQRPNEGLAALVFEPSPSGRQFLAGAAKPLETLTGWLRVNIHAETPSLPSTPVKDLLGLGLGLTPSGDDFIGAMLICLGQLGAMHSQASLAQAVSDHAPICTNQISQQHLVAATKGFGSAQFHKLLIALQSGTSADTSSALTDLTAVGHTSGWDALAGLYTTLKIWHDAQRTQQVAA